MSFKDDPLRTDTSRFADRVLYVEPESMQKARHAFWVAYEQSVATSGPPSLTPTEQDWNMAWAAAVAAFSYLMEGRTGPR